MTWRTLLFGQRAVQILVALQFLQNIPNPAAFGGVIL